LLLSDRRSLSPHLLFQFCQPRSESTHIQKLNVRIAQCVSHKTMPLVHKRCRPASSAAPASMLTELSQLPMFFSFFALIFIVKPRVFIVAF
jgi:hypothetical protein